VGSVFDVSVLWGGGRGAAAKRQKGDAAEVVDPLAPLAKVDANLARAYRTPTHPGRKGTGPRKVNLETNWRLKFRVPVEPPAAAAGISAATALAPRLRVRTWRHMPWYSSDHLLGEAVFELQPLLRAAARYGNAPQNVGIQVVALQPVGHYGTKGRLWMQVSLVPEAVWRFAPVGLGRSEPNKDPFVPAPYIPPQTTWWERNRRCFIISAVCLTLLVVIVAIVAGVLANRKP